MGFVGNYAPCGLSPQMYDMPVILKKGAAKCGAFHILHVAKRAYLSSYFLTITVAL